MTRRRILVGLALFAAAGLVAVGATRLAGDDDDSQAQPRKVAALSDNKRTATVWAVGDGADGGDRARRVARVIERSRPDRVLYLGDVYDQGTAEEFDRNYRPVYGRLAGITAPTPGNHDWPRHEEGYDPYWRKANPRLPRNRHWYSFKTAGWEFLSLNSQEEHAEGTPQQRWAERAVSERGTCRIAFWHRPFLNAGRHGDQPDVEPLWNTVRDHAVLVIGGHDHNLQHFKRSEGLVQLVSGAGGHEFYSSNQDDPRLAWDEDDEAGAVRLDLRRGLARFRFVNEDGRTLHRGRVRCRPLTG
ncbi:MAG TPA: metallophosphoesterase [Solirubrobacterales bacterium]|nr:metallophosphoesterase [Solirubrobacterales bacterium]